MTSPALGIDIVDLSAEREVSLHPRYRERVLAPSERSIVASEIDLWRHWAAKEAAFKAVSRHAPGTVFAHKEFVFIPQDNVVAYAGRGWPVRIEQNGGYALAVCVNKAEMLADVKVWVGPGDPIQHSVQVRELARQRLAAELNISAHQVDLDNLPGLLSFSHHGRYVACAWYLDGAASN